MDPANIAFEIGSMQARSYFNYAKSLPYSNEPAKQVVDVGSNIIYKKVWW